jgi:hypothetical protein
MNDGVHLRRWSSAFLDTRVAEAVSHPQKTVDLAGLEPVWA